MIVHRIDLGLVGTAQLAAQLHIVGRVGEHQVGAAFGQGAACARRNRPRSPGPVSMCSCPARKLSTAGFTVIRRDSPVKSLVESKCYDLSPRIHPTYKMCVDISAADSADRCGIDCGSVRSCGGDGWSRHAGAGRHNARACRNPCCSASYSRDVRHAARAIMPVARDLGDDRGRGDGNRARIAAHQRVAVAGQGRRIIAVHQRELRRHAQARAPRAPSPDAWPGGY